MSLGVNAYLGVGEDCTTILSATGICVGSVGGRTRSNHAADGGALRLEKVSVEGSRGLELVKAWKAVKHLPDEIKLNPDDLEIISAYMARTGKSADDVAGEIPDDLDGARRWLDDISNRKLQTFRDWVNSLQTKLNSGRNLDDGKFERVVTGDDN